MIIEERKLKSLRSHDSLILFISLYQVDFSLYYKYLQGPESHSFLGDGYHCIFGHLQLRSFLLRLPFSDLSLCQFIPGVSNHLNSLDSIQTFVFVVMQLQGTVKRHDVYKQCLGGKPPSKIQIKW